jgi:hypothetical protein
MRLKFLLLLLVFLSNIMGKTAQIDSTEKYKVGLLKTYKSDNDIETEVELTNNKDYIHHYRYRFSLGLMTLPYNLKGNNERWNTNSNSINYGPILKTTATLNKCHKLNLSISMGMISGKNTFQTNVPKNYSNGKKVLNSRINKFDLTYSYVGAISKKYYLEIGGGGSLVFLSSKHPDFSFEKFSPGYVANTSILRRLTKEILIFGNLSYSYYKIKGIKAADKPVLNTDKLEIRTIGINIGIQLLTKLSDTIY